MELGGKRALIIGGGGAGIGRAISRAYGTAGASVVVADVDVDRATEAVAEIEAAGGRAHPITGDVRSIDQVEAMVTGAAEWAGGLDVLVTVVGGQVAFVPAVRLHEMADEDWDSIYELNLRMSPERSGAASRVFLDQGTGGAVVSVGSVTGFMAAPRQGAYGVAKAGILSLARTVAAEYASDGVRMNVIVTGGAIATAVANEDSEGEWIDDVPVGGSARPRRWRVRPCTSRPTLRHTSPDSSSSSTAACRFAAHSSNTPR